MPVQSCMCLAGDASNAVPFSWRIREHVEELCLQAQYIGGAHGEHMPWPPHLAPAGGATLLAPGYQEQWSSRDAAGDFFA